MDRRIDHLVEQELARRQGSGSSSLGISSIHCAGASSMKPPAGCQQRPGLPIAHPPKASMSRASIASALRSPRAGSP